MTAPAPDAAAAAVPVLDIGGTHVTAALVDPSAGRTLVTTRRPLGAHATADGILDAIALAARELPAGHNPHWGVAIPGPFDYAGGIGIFTGIGKFESLHGVDVGAGLRRRLPGRAERLRFLNDADAFAIGEHRAGAAAGHDRVVCLTLGTGVGSSFLAAGRPVHDGATVPPGGVAHRLTVRGRPLEDTVSRRAIRADHARRTGTAPGGDLLDVHEIAALAADGDTGAQDTFRYAFGTLGQALAPWIDRFEATAVVVGGSIAQSWDLIHPAFVAGLTADGGTAVPVLPSRQPARAPLIGAAHWALEAPGPS
ncbi:ROK family protein [Actinacidiphila alni]|uniref:ROK family protein n=1 Tax=Actinacidiphila alni TaxID=380248 RepID=UPI0033DD9406